LIQVPAALLGSVTAITMPEKSSVQPILVRDFVMAFLLVKLSWTGENAKKE